MTQAEVLSVVLLFVVFGISLCVGILHNALSDRIDYLEFELQLLKKEKDGAE